ncbi:MAG: hypothetical protein MJA30_35200, partial [Cytophagales bacterium]|nr:hypothetical protein [Cytophagales bacterium]
MRIINPQAKNPSMMSLGLNKILLVFVVILFGVDGYSQIQRNNAFGEHGMICAGSPPDNQKTFTYYVGHECAFEPASVYYWSIEPVNAGTIVQSNCRTEQVKVRWNYSIVEQQPVKLKVSITGGQLLEDEGCAILGNCYTNHSLDVFMPKAPNPALITHPTSVASNGLASITFRYTEPGAATYFSAMQLRKGGTVLGEVGINSSITNTTTEFGSLEYQVYIKNTCDEWIGPFTKVVNVRPTCEGAYQPILSVQGVGQVNGGYEVETGVNYTLRLDADGAPDFNSHYTLSHDGGSLLNLNSSNMTFTTSAILASFNISYNKLPGRESCPDVTPIIVTVGGANEVIDKDCAFVLPRDFGEFPDIEVEPND